MGISIAIRETDAPEALCRERKKHYIKVFLRDIKGFEEYADWDMTISAEEAKKVFGSDWDIFLKRNRIEPTSEVIYLEKIKVEEDKIKLMPLMKKSYSGWVSLEKIPISLRERILEISSPDDRLTSWDMLSFDEMGEICNKCGLSWDKGRGCIGDFGPESSLLPQVAKKYELDIIANVVENAKTKKIFTENDAKKLLREIEILRQKMPNEPKGKLLISRYTGVLERLEAVANICLKYKIGFYFV